MYNLLCSNLAFFRGPCPAKSIWAIARMRVSDQTRAHSPAKYASDHWSTRAFGGLWGFGWMRSSRKKARSEQENVDAYCCPAWKAKKSRIWLWQQKYPGPGSDSLLAISRLVLEIRFLKNWAQIQDFGKPPGVDSESGVRPRSLNEIYFYFLRIYVQYRLRGMNQHHHQCRKWHILKQFVPISGMGELPRQQQFSAESAQRGMSKTRIARKRKVEGYLPPPEENAARAVGMDIGDD